MSEADPDQFSITPPMPVGENSAPDLELKPLVLGGGYLTHRLTEQTDRLFFNLGAVYEYVGVPVDILNQFEIDTGVKLDLETHISSTPLVTGLNEWRFVVQSVSKELENPLYSWLAGQEFHTGDKTGNKTWRLAGEITPIADPYAVERMEIVDRDKYVDVTFVLPYGDHGRVVLDVPLNGVRPHIQFGATGVS